MDMKKFYWVETARRCSLSARVQVQAHDSKLSYYTGINEKDMEPIQEWCQQNRCGRRVSFDTFQFKNKAQITMFLLRWSS